MRNDILPLGSVVVLNDSTKKVMITGYVCQGDDDEKVYDYCGCIFPEAIMENYYCLFNDSQIACIFFEGLRNEDSDKYLGKINSILTNRETAYRLANGGKRSVEPERKHGRVPKPAKHPISVDEMWSRYAVTKKSGPDELNALIERNNRGE